LAFKKSWLRNSFGWQFPPVPPGFRRLFIIGTFVAHYDFRKGALMTHNLKTFVMNTLIVGALMTPASALAKDYWHWHDNRWDHRADLRSDVHDLQEAKRQLEYDQHHHATRRKIAEDESRVRDIERDIHADRAARH
jgi:hypothetical protein